jgi:NADH:ubiquinone oxidoreductase subunit 2 (subunit N)
VSIFIPIIPEFFIFLSAVILLVVGLFVKNIKLIINLSILALLIAIVLVFMQSIQTVFNNSLGDR